MTAPKRTGDWVFSTFLSILTLLSVWTLTTVLDVDKKMAVVEEKVKLLNDHESRIRALEVRKD